MPTLFQSISSPGTPPLFEEIFAQCEALIEVPRSDGRSDIPIHVYRLLSPPLLPIREQQYISILAVYPAVLHSAVPLPPIFRTYDAHIRGKISITSPAIDGWITMVLQNECRASVAQKVAVMIPDIPGTIFQPNSEGLATNNECIGERSNVLSPRISFLSPVHGTRCGGERCILNVAGGRWSSYISSRQIEEMVRYETI